MLAFAGRGGSRPDRRLARAGLALWGGLAAAVAGYALLTWSLEPRSRYPTASELVGHIDDARPVKLALFLGWLGLGLVIARR